MAPAALVFRIASADAFRRTRERIGAITGYLQETLSGIRVVRSFGQERRHIGRFADLNQANRDANMTTVYLNAAYFPGVELLSSLVTVGILLFGGFQVIDGNAQTGVVFGFIAALNQFFDPIQQLSQLYTTYQSGMAALDKIFELLDEEPELVDRPDAVELRRRCAARSSFEDVSFRYGDDDDGPWALRRRRPARRRRARRSRSSARRAPASRRSRSSSRASTTRRAASCGSTATTCATCRSASLRAQMGIVPQEGFLFSGTIAENIAFGRPDATRRGGRRRGARPSAPTRSSSDLPHGYDTRGRRARRAAVGRPAPARRVRARADRRPAHPRARRGDLERRHPHRDAHRGGPADACSPAAPRS